jgi:hypothetical protein
VVPVTTHHRQEWHRDASPTASEAALLAVHESPGTVSMSTIGTATSFPKRLQKSERPLSFSPTDARLITDIIAVLSAEMESSTTIDYETRARIFFYIGFHRYVIQRLPGLLDTEASADGSDLGNQINEAFEYLTSQSILESQAFTNHVYRSKVVALSDSMCLLLQLVQSREKQKLNNHYSVRCR